MKYTDHRCHPVKRPCTDLELQVGEPLQGKLQVVRLQVPAPALGQSRVQAQEMALMRWARATVLHLQDQASVLSLWAQVPVLSLWARATVLNLQAQASVLSLWAQASVIPRHAGQVREPVTLELCTCEELSLTSLRCLPGPHGRNTTRARTLLRVIAGRRPGATNLCGAMLGAEATGATAGEGLLDGGWALCSACGGAGAGADCGSLRGAGAGAEMLCFGGRGEGTEGAGPGLAAPWAGCVECSGEWAVECTGDGAGTGCGGWATGAAKGGG